MSSQNTITFDRQIGRNMFSDPRATLDGNGPGDSDSSQPLKSRVIPSTTLDTGDMWAFGALVVLVVVTLLMYIGKNDVFDFSTYTKGAISTTSNPGFGTLLGMISMAMLFFSRIMTPGKHFEKVTSALPLYLPAIALACFVVYAYSKSDLSGVRQNLMGYATAGSLTLSATDVNEAARRDTFTVSQHSKNLAFWYSVALLVSGAVLAFYSGWLVYDNFSGKGVNAPVIARACSVISLLAAVVMLGCAVWTLMYYDKETTALVDGTAPDAPLA